MISSTAYLRVPFVSPPIPVVLFFAWLCFSSLNGSVLRIYLCANAAFHHTFSQRSRLCFVCLPLMHKLTHECFSCLRKIFCAFSSIYSFHNQALFVLIFLHVNNRAFFTALWFVKAECLLCLLPLRDTEWKGAYIMEKSLVLRITFAVNKFLFW